MTIRLMTYNILHGEDFRSRKIDLAQIAEVIRSVDPDIVLLNEVRGAGENEYYTAQTEAIARLLGFNGAFCRAFDVPGCGPYGNAVLSKHPFACTVVPIPAPETLDNSPEFEPRCVVRAAFTAGPFEAQPFTVFGTHFGLSADEQKCAVRTVCELLDGETAPAAFMGDLNLTPENPILAPVQARLHDTAGLWSERKLSFPSDAPAIKIDYIFVSDGVTALRADIPAVTASDHRPYWADIRIG